MKVCELGNPVAIKANKYDILAAKKLANYSDGQADHVVSKLTPG